MQSQESTEKIDAKVTVSKIEMLLGLLTFALHYSLNNKAVQDLFKLINLFLNCDVLPDTLYHINKLFSSDDSIEYHGVCPNCNGFRKKFNKKKTRKIYCPKCKKYFSVKSQTANFFVILNVEDKIKKLLENNSNYYMKIMNEKLVFDGNIKDITLSKEYLKFRNSLPPDELKSYASCIFNSDGSPVFKSSNNSIWPIQIILNELPIDVRLNNPITWALWFGKSKPNMNIFLEAFVESMNKFSEKGIDCKINGKTENIKLYAICSAVDSQARAPMQGLKLFNGKYGCGWCYHEGVPVKQKKKKVIKYPLLNYIPKKRTEKETKQHIKLLKDAKKNKKQSVTDIFGINKESPLVKLKKFKIIRGFVPDVMHCVFLGVCKQFANYWFSVKKKPFSLNKDKINFINNLLNKIRVPKIVNRLSRTIFERKHWKSRDWENFLLYYSVPVLSKIQGFKKYVEHWSLLVEAIKILIKNEITRDQLILADSKLKDFIAQTQQLYGAKSMTYNVHQLSHLVQSVIDFGPLLSHSCYAFESGNGKILKMVKSSNGVVPQVCRTLQFEECAAILKEKVDLIQDSPIKDFANYLKNSHYTSKSIKFDNSGIRYFGKSFFVKQKWKNELSLSENSNCFRRMYKENCLHSSDIGNWTRSDNSIALTQEGIVQIVEFLVDYNDEKEFTICKQINAENALFTEGSIKLVTNIDDELIAIPTTSIIKPAVLIRTNEESYICDIPSVLNH